MQDAAVVSAELPGKPVCKCSADLGSSSMGLLESLSHAEPHEQC